MMSTPHAFRSLVRGAACSSAAALFTTLLACSSSSSTETVPSGAVDAGVVEDASATEPTETPDAGEACAAPKKSKCGKTGSWVRGIAHFDPARYAGKTPTLRVVLRHYFTLARGEEMIGGRLHWYESVKVTDPSKGEIPFALDMCESTIMWSEENGKFHLVLIMDENDNNDLDDATSIETALQISAPDKGELTKMVDVELSCNAPSPCLDVTLDCVDGTACTTFEPMTSCKPTTPGCKSQSTFCK